MNEQKHTCYLVLFPFPRVLFKGPAAIFFYSLSTSQLLLERLKPPGEGKDDISLSLYIYGHEYPVC